MKKETEKERYLEKTEKPTRIGIQQEEIHMNAVILTEGMMNEAARTIYGAGAVVKFIEDMEMEAIVVYEGAKIVKIMELDTVLTQIGNHFNSKFVSYDVIELGELGVGYSFKVRVSADVVARKCA